MSKLIKTNNVPGGHVFSSQYLHSLIDLSLWFLNLLVLQKCVSWLSLHIKDVSLGCGNKYLVFKENNFHFQSKEYLFVYYTNIETCLLCYKSCNDMKLQSVKFEKQYWKDHSINHSKIQLYKSGNWHHIIVI